MKFKPKFDAILDKTALRKALQVIKLAASDLTNSWPRSPDGHSGLGTSVPSVQTSRDDSLIWRLPLMKVLSSSHFCNDFD